MRDEEVDSGRKAGDCRDYPPNATGALRGSGLSVNKNTREREWGDHSFGIRSADDEEVEDARENMREAAELLSGDTEPRILPDGGIVEAERGRTPVYEYENWLRIDDVFEVEEALDSSFYFESRPSPMEVDYRSDGIDVCIGDQTVSYGISDPGAACNQSAREFLMALGRSGDIDHDFLSEIAMEISDETGLPFNQLDGYGVCGSE